MPNETPTDITDTTEIKPEKWGDVSWEEPNVQEPEASEAVDTGPATEQAAPDEEEQVQEIDHTDELEVEPVIELSSAEKVSLAVTKMRELLKKQQKKLKKQQKHLKEVESGLESKSIDADANADYESLLERAKDVVQNSHLRQRIELRQQEVQEAEHVLSLLDRVDEWWAGDLDPEKVAKFKLDVLKDYDISLEDLGIQNQIEVKEAPTGEEEIKPGLRVFKKNIKSVREYEVTGIEDGQDDQTVVLRDIESGELVKKLRSSLAEDLETSGSVWAKSANDFKTETGISNREESEAGIASHEEPEDHRLDELTTKVSSPEAFAEMQASYEAAAKSASPDTEDQQLRRDAVEKYLSYEWDSDIPVPAHLISDLAGSLKKVEAPEPERKLDWRSKVFNVDENRTYAVARLGQGDEEGYIWLKPLGQDGNPEIDGLGKKLLFKQLEEDLNGDAAEWRWSDGVHNGENDDKPLEDEPLIRPAVTESTAPEFFDDEHESEEIKVGQEVPVFWRGSGSFQVGKGWKVESKIEKGDKLYYRVTKEEDGKKETIEVRQGVLEAWTAMFRKPEDDIPKDQESATKHLTKSYKSIKEKISKGFLRKKEAARARKIILRYHAGGLATSLALWRPVQEIEQPPEINSPPR